MATDEVEYVCTLEPKLVKKAEEELNEKPQWRSRDIQALRDMVVKHPGLKARTDDTFLLRFLRARKFDYDRAFQLLLNYYKMKLENKEVFDNLKPSMIKHVLEDGVVGLLPHCDKEGRNVTLMRPGRWNPEKYPLIDIFRTNFLTLSKIIENEEAQVNGIIFIIDLKDVGLNHARQISPFFARKMTSLIQETFPARIKGIHYVNEPTVFDVIFAIIRPFLKEKLVKRLHFHGQNVSELHQFINPEYLPEEYNGKQPPYSNKEWSQLLLSCDAEFENDSKYGLEELKVIPSVIKEDALECIVGTYKRLEI